MHYVRRGPEPGGLKEVRERYTHGWIRYYRKHVGAKPSDDKWRDFQPDLEKPFRGLCGYCEEECKGEVDHFRPKSRFPERVYQWSNWVLSCHDCNHMKGEEWPSPGYIDPCAPSASQRPEHFFEFDTLTGEILPKRGLSRLRKSRAKKMIGDLRLNAGHHLRKRRWWIEVLRASLAGGGTHAAAHAGFVAAAVSRDAPLSSLTRALLGKLGYEW